MQSVFLISVPEVEGEVDSISSLCSQITNAFSTPSEDPFSSAPMTKPVTAVAPQSPAFQGVSSSNLDALMFVTYYRAAFHWCHCFHVSNVLQPFCLHLKPFCFVHLYACSLLCLHSYRDEDPNTTYTLILGKDLK